MRPSRVESLCLDLDKQALTTRGTSTNSGRSIFLSSLSLQPRGRLVDQNAAAASHLLSILGGGPAAAARQTTVWQRSRRRQINGKC
jgi:hypothetical protein